MVKAIPTLFRELTDLFPEYRIRFVGTPYVPASIVFERLLEKKWLGIFKRYERIAAYRIGKGTCLAINKEEADKIAERVNFSVYY